MALNHQGRQTLISGKQRVVDLVLARIDRLTFAFRSVLSRPPTDAERKALLELLDKQRTRFDSGALNPNEVATGSKEAPANLPPGVTPTELASWTVVSRVLLNLDETITKE